VGWSWGSGSGVDTSRGGIGDGSATADPRRDDTRRTAIRCALLQRVSRCGRPRRGPFPAAEIAASIDGRTVVPAHGSREMPIWGERFGAMGGGGSVGEEVVRGHLLVLMAYLQSIQP